MHYNMLHYLMTGLIPQFMTEFLLMRTSLETLSDDDKAIIFDPIITYLNIQTEDYTLSNIEPEVPEQYQEYVRAAKILVMLQKLFDVTNFEIYLINNIPNLSTVIYQACMSILQHFASQIEPLKAIALSERHVNHYYLRLVAGLVGIQASHTTYRLINKLYLDTNEQKKFTELGLFNIFETLSKSPINYQTTNAIFQKVLNDLATNTNTLLIENRDLMNRSSLEHQQKIAENQKKIDQSLKSCFLIMEKFVFPVTIQVKKAVLNLYQPLLLISDQDKTELLGVLEQYQLENSIYIYDRFLRQLDNNINLELVYKRLDTICKQIYEKNYIQAIILMMTFYQDEKIYKDLLIDRPLIDFFNLNKKLYSPSNFQTPDYSNAIIKSSAMHELKELLINANSATSLLYSFLKMPVLTSQDSDNLNKVIKNMKKTFKKNPCPELSSEKDNDIIDKICYQDLNQFYKIIKYYSINHDSYGILTSFNRQSQSIVEIAVNLCKILEKILKKIPEARSILQIESDNQECLYFTTKFSNELGLFFNDPLRVHLYAIKENPDLDPATKKNEAIRKIFSVFQDAMANKNFHVSNRIEKKLLKLMHNFSSDHKAQFIVLMMAHTLLKFLHQVKESIIKKRIEYIHRRLLHILRRLGKAIPIEKQQFYRGASYFSSEAILEDIVQQLHKELLLLRPIMPIETNLNWLQKAKKIWHGDEYKKLYVVLENLLTEYQPYLPKHCQQVIPVMAALRCNFENYEFLVNEQKFKLAQNKR